MSTQVSPSHPEAYVVVDPISTGANVAFEIAARGFPVICVMSGHLAPALLHMIDPTVRVAFAARLEHNSSSPSYDAIISALKALPFKILNVVSGSEPGVELTDVLTEALGLPTNGTKLSAARRDKYFMGETVRAAGVRAVKQAKVAEWKQVEAFLEDLKPNPFKVVIKPIKSAGSDHVYLCESVDELKIHFDEIVGRTNQLGQTNDAAVLQEFLSGTEYVVDSVSRNGVHKIVAVWAYDKRSVHGTHFVYFGMSSVDCTSDIAKQLVEYQKKVLTALSIKHGAGHGEVIMTKTGPCLVEVGARCHGCEGTFMPLADRCWGQNQVGCLIDAVAPTSEAFDKIPDMPPPSRDVCFKVDLVSSVKGKLKALKHLDEMQALPSFMNFDCLPNVGDKINVTVDCFTAVGGIALAHKDQAQINSDLEKIRQWQKTMFDVEESSSSDAESVKRF